MHPASSPAQRRRSVPPRRRFLAALVLPAAFFTPPAPAATVDQLRCEYQERPLAIEAARPRLSWIMQDDHTGARQTAYRVLVASASDRLAEGKADLWDSGRVAVDTSVHIPYLGKPLVSGQRAWWTVRIWDADGTASDYASATYWEMGALQPADWTAKLIRMREEPAFSNDAVEHWIRYGIGRRVPPSARAWVEQRMKPAPYFRREFTLEGAPTRARLRIASLGHYELRLNGQRVGDRQLDPAYQEYDRQVYYVTHDVTSLLKRGANALGATLGNGWFNQRGQFFGIPKANFTTHRDEVGPAGLVLQLEIEVGGRTIRVETDAEWKASYGPLLRNELFIGEVYDARREIPGWDRPGFAAADWQPVEAVPAPVDRLVAMQVAPERAVREVKAVRILEPVPGIYVADLGETIAGWPKLTVQETAGTMIAIRPSPFIRNQPQFMQGHPLPYPDPQLDGKFLPNMIGGELAARLPDADMPERARFHTCDVFVTAGHGRETFERKFSYVGFRYLEITGLTRKPSPDDVRGVVVHTDLPSTGRFACSDPRVNELYASFDKTLRYVTHGLVNDNSDAEKNSFRGHQAMAGDFLAYAWNHPPFWAKAARDIRLQTPTEGPTAGMPPVKAPAPRYFHARAIGALNALIDTVFEPTRALLFNADRETAAGHLDLMLKFVDLFGERMVDPRPLSEFDRQHEPVGILMQGDWLDVWKNGPRPQMGVGASSDGDVVYRCLFVIGLNRLIGTTRVLGQGAVADQLDALRERISREINRRAYDRVRKSYGSQAANVLALQAGVVPPADVAAVAADLRRQIMVEWEGHLSVGFIGGRYISSVLSAFGHPAVAHHLWKVNTWPSWGWLLESGYDTSNSYWNDFNVPGKLPSARFIQSEKPVAVTWCYESLAGIQPVYDRPGFKHFIVAPAPPPDMQWAEAEVHTVQGTIKSRWQRQGDAITYQITVPANTTATLRFPATRDLAHPPAGLRPRGIETGPGGSTASFEAGAGSHTLTIPNS